MILEFTLCLLGLGIHFSLKWAEARASKPDSPPGLIQYIQSVPAQSLSTVLSTTAVFMLGFSMEWMSPLAAFSSGWMGSSIAENLANKFKV